MPQRLHRLLAGVAVLAAFGLGSLRAQHISQVLTVTDVADAGRNLQPPTPENPTYYRAISYGCDYGSMSGDKKPEVTRMTKFIVDLLAKQGYRGADETHAATLYLSFQWGFRRASLSQNLAYLGGEKLDLMWELQSSSVTPPWARRAARTPTADKVMAIADKELYVLTINAFDYESVEVHNKPVLLWQTRIACPANGTSMAKAMPRLITAAASLVGRETALPVWKRADDGPEGKVELGEAEVLGVEDEPPRAP